MKRLLSGLLMMAVLALAVVAFADKELPVFKKGEVVYVCGCGAGCDCYTLSRKAGTCSCNKPLVKTEVTNVEGEKVFAKVNGKEQSFISKAKFACACGDGCTCGTISQKPGKCGCGTDMKAVK